MALDQYALITATAGLSYVGAGTASSDRVQMEDLINSATSYIEDTLLQTKLKARTFTEQVSGSGLGSMLVLKQYPVISVASLHDDIDRVFGDDTLIPTADYYVYEDEGIIELVASRFVSGVANVKVVFDGGYNTVPYITEQACKLLVSSEWNSIRTQSWGIAARSDGHGDSVTYDVYSGGAGKVYNTVTSMLSSMIRMKM